MKSKYLFDFIENYEPMKSKDVSSLSWQEKGDKVYGLIIVTLIIELQLKRF